jgi:glycosyltransferase involved in cell wall biosynthesis
MKILMVNALYPPHKVGGAEKSVALLAQSLVEAGDEVAVATLDDRAEPDMKIENGVRVHRLPIDNIYWPYGDVNAAPPSYKRIEWHWRNRWNMAAAARLGTIIDLEKPDVVHCNVLTGFSVAAWAAIKDRKLPIVQTLRDYAVICTRSALFKNGQQCATRCAQCRVITSPGKAASRMVDQLVSNSNYVIRAHHDAGYFDGVPARRIFNIVLLEDKARDVVADETPIRFGFIGRIEPEKGIEQVLAACAVLQRPDWTLKIAGVGVDDYVEALKSRYPDPRIEWLGFAQADAFYRTIDVVLIASVWPEPLPRTLIESLSYRLSVICSSAGGIPEIADLARKSISYDAMDAGALAQAMTVAIDDKADWRAGGLKDTNSLSLFAKDAVVSAYRSAYADAIAYAGRK